jgi:hypothetical protein
MTKTKTKIVIAGQTLWPVRWKFVLFVAGKASYHLFVTYLAIIAFALLVPNYPQIGPVDESLLRTIGLIKRFVSPMLQAYLPLWLVATTIGRHGVAATEAFWQIEQSGDDDPLQWWAVLGISVIFVVVVQRGGI